MKIISGIFQKINEYANWRYPFYCPLCQRSYREFLPAGVVPRLNACCPGCGSLERHRLLWIALEHLWKSKKISNKGKMLHVAPEKYLEKRFKDLYDYLSVDLEGDRAMQSMDITNMDFPDGYFDAIVCNHVLEHIPDDRKALAELCRVLKSGGWGSIQVPMKGDLTLEDLSIYNPLDRERLFGQHDHVRQYGTDFQYRLEEAGFKVMLFPKEELSNPEMLMRLSVTCENHVLICKKV